MRHRTALAFSNVELEVGREQIIPGAGKVKITGKETIAGLEGYVCELFTTEGSREQRSFVMVIRPGLALPLRSVVYGEDGKPRYEKVLLEYEKH